MKIREGFVSNSSSSSFICDLCKRHSEGWTEDQYGDHGMALCENGHALCKDHFGLDYPKFQTGRVLKSYCPICELAKKMKIEIHKQTENTNEWDDYK